MTATNPLIEELLKTYIQHRDQGDNETQAWNATRAHAKSLFATYLEQARLKISTWEAKNFYGQDTGLPPHLAKATGLHRAVTTGEFGAVETLHDYSQTVDKPDYMEQLAELGMQDAATTSAAPPSRAGYFPDRSRLVIYVDQYPDPLLLRPRSGETLSIGIRKSDTERIPDLDLTYFEGAKQGVVADHASLIHHDDQLVLTAHRGETFVNGDPLPAGSAHVLVDGDAVHFGDLRINVGFMLPG